MRVAILIHFPLDVRVVIPKHGEIIESTYLLGDNGPKPLWKRVLGFIVLLATLVAFSYLVIFLFHNGNHRPDAREPSTKPTPPLRGAVHSSCASHPACAGEHRGGAPRAIVIPAATCLTLLGIRHQSQCAIIKLYLVLFICCSRRGHWNDNAFGSTRQLVTVDLYTLGHSRTYLTELTPVPPFATPVHDVPMIPRSLCKHWDWRIPAAPTPTATCFPAATND